MPLWVVFMPIKNITIDIEVDNTLCDNLYYSWTSASDNVPVKAMPSNYYTLSDNKITLNNVLMNGVEVSFTDAFFADPEALTSTYVIPLVMTGVTNADRILMVLCPKERKLSDAIRLCGWCNRRIMYFIV